MVRHERTRRRRRTQARTYVTCQLRFAGGLRAWSLPTLRWDFEVMGSEGSIRLVNSGADVALRRRGDDGRVAWKQAFAAVPPKSPVVACLEDLVSSTERPPEQGQRRDHPQRYRAVRRGRGTPPQGRRMGGVALRRPGSVLFSRGSPGSRIQR